MRVWSKPQVGLNGVDNGAVRFSHVRVPRTNLLDRFASVDKSGRYSSPLTSEVRQLRKTLQRKSYRQFAVCPCIFKAPFVRQSSTTVSVLGPAIATHCVCLVCLYNSKM